MSNNKTMNDSDVSGIILRSPFESGLSQFGETRLEDLDDDWDEETVPVSKVEKNWFI